MDAGDMINNLIRKGVTEKDIAEHVGVSQSTVNKIKHGISKNPLHKNVVGIESLYRMIFLDKNGARK